MSAGHSVELVLWRPAELRSNVTPRTRTMGCRARSLTVLVQREGSAAVLEPSTSRFSCSSWRRCSANFTSHSSVKVLLKALFGTFDIVRRYD